MLFKVFDCRLTALVLICHRALGHFAYQPLQVQYLAIPFENMLCHNMPCLTGRKMKVNWNMSDVGLISRSGLEDPSQTSYVF